MKEWAVAFLAVIGGYVALNWFAHHRGRSLGWSGQIGGPATATDSNLARVQGIGNYAISPIASGVPTYSDLQISNGHGDQVAAAYHTNVMASMSGGPIYQPAFGPNENRNDDLEVF